MKTVKQLYDELGQLIKEGHGDTRVIANCEFNITKGNGYYNDFPLCYLKDVYYQSGDIELEFSQEEEFTEENKYKDDNNGWHKVSDNLPEMDVLVYLWNNVDDFPVVACRHIPYGNKEWVWSCKWGSGYTVSQSVGKDYLWKEIIPPKEESMFEKEAEKWVENNLHNTEEDYIKAFKDGADFGFNKANEWHDLIADPNDLPKEEHKLPSECKNYYVVWFGKNNFSGAKFINGKFYDGEFIYYPDEIVKWKEIILPEE